MCVVPFCGGTQSCQNHKAAALFTHSLGPVHGDQGKSTRRWTWHAICLGADLLRDPCRSDGSRKVLSYRASLTWGLYKGLVYWEAMYWQGRLMHSVSFSPIAGLSSGGDWKREATSTQQQQYIYKQRYLDNCFIFCLFMYVYSFWLFKWDKVQVC